MYICMYIYLYVSYSRLTVGPSGLKFFEETLKFRGGKIDYFFSIRNFYYVKKMIFFKSEFDFLKFHGQRRALQLVYDIY